MSTAAGSGTTMNGATTNGATRARRRMRARFEGTATGATVEQGSGGTQVTFDDVRVARLWDAAPLATDPGVRPSIGLLLPDRRLDYEQAGAVQSALVRAVEIEDFDIDPVTRRVTGVVRFDVDEPVAAPPRVTPVASVPLPTPAGDARLRVDVAGTAAVATASTTPRTTATVEPPARRDDRLDAPPLRDPEGVDFPWWLLALGAALAWLVWSQRGAVRGAIMAAIAVAVVWTVDHARQRRAAERYRRGVA